MRKDENEINNRSRVDSGARHGFSIGFHCARTDGSWVRDRSYEQIKCRRKRFPSLRGEAHPHPRPRTGNAREIEVFCSRGLAEGMSKGLAVHSWHWDRAKVDDNLRYFQFILELLLLLLLVLLSLLLLLLLLPPLESCFPRIKSALKKASSLGEHPSLSSSLVTLGCIYVVPLLHLLPFRHL